MAAPAMPDGAAYGAPPPGYGAPPPGYGAPPPGYGYPPPPEYAGYPPPEYAGYPPPGYDAYAAYGPPPPGYDPAGYAAAAAAYGPPPPGYGGPPPPGYPGFPGYGDPALAGYYAAYGPPPPGYEMFGPPPPGYPPPPGMPGLGYGPAEPGGSKSSGGADRARSRGGRTRGGRKRGGRGGAGDSGGGGGGSSGGYGKAPDNKGRGQDRSQPYTVEPVQANNLYVTGLPAEVDENRLRALFAEHGKVSQCKIFPPRPGESKTVALIRFDTAEGAKAGKDAMNGRTIDDFPQQISVRFAENKAAREKEAETTQEGTVKVTGPGIDGIVSAFEAIGPLKATRGHEHHKGQLYVAGLPPDTANVHLYRLFGPFGSIGPKGVHAMMTQDGRSKGIAFVNFLEEESAQLAIATYNGAVLPDGTTLKVSMKMPKNATK